MRKSSGTRKTQDYTPLKFKGDSFIVKKFIEPQVRCSVKLFPALINYKRSVNMKNVNLNFSPIACLCHYYA